MFGCEKGEIRSEILFCKHKRGKHGQRHGQGKGSSTYKQNGRQGKKGCGHLPPEKREQRFRENQAQKKRDIANA